MRLKTFLTLIFSALLISSCATKKDHEEIAEHPAIVAPSLPAGHNQEKTADQLGKNFASTVTFKKGEKELPADITRKLDSAIAEARSRGEIDVIDIAVWSDREYPADKQKLASGEVKLAKERGKFLEKYLDRKDPGAKVKVHNMAKQPTAFSEFFDTHDANLKEQITELGIAPEGENSGKIGKSSKALILIKLK